MRRTAFVRALVVLAVGLFLAATNLPAQTSNVQIVGDVIDPTSAAVSGANVTVTSQPTGVGLPVSPWDSASATQPTHLPSHQRGFGGYFEGVNQ